MDKHIAIVFFSAAGTTQKLAFEIANGANSITNVKTKIFPIENEHIIKGRYIDKKVFESINNADALIMGSPTYMGGPAAQFKAFADASSESWYSQRWKNKLAAGFTVGSNLNGDQHNTINYFSIFAGQHGMLWAGLDKGTAGTQLPNRLGNQQGLIAQSTSESLDSEDLLAARYFGQRIASLSFART